MMLFGDMDQRNSDPDVGLLLDIYRRWEIRAVKSFLWSPDINMHKRYVVIAEPLSAPGCGYPLGKFCVAKVA